MPIRTYLLRRLDDGSIEIPFTPFNDFASTQYLRGLLNGIAKSELEGDYVKTATCGCFSYFRIRSTGLKQIAFSTILGRLKSDLQIEVQPITETRNETSGVIEIGVKGRVYVVVKHDTEERFAISVSDMGFDAAGAASPLLEQAALSYISRVDLKQRLAEIEIENADVSEMVEWMENHKTTNSEEPANKS